MPLPFHLLMFRAGAAQRGALRPYMSRAGLSPGQPKILTFLSSHPECMQKELAAAYDIEPATVSRLLENMEKDRLIERRADPSDRRAACVRITERGRAAHAEMEGYCVQADEKALDGFTPEERAAFRGYLCRMYRNLTGNEIE